MPHINIKKQSCACCYSPDAKVECTLVLGSHTIPICRDCLIDLYNQLNETLCSGAYASETNYSAKYMKSKGEENVHL